jgi:hypothetical protein
MIWIRTRPKNPKTLPYGASYNAATVGDHRAAVLMSGLRHHLSRPRRRQPVSGFIAVQEGKSQDLPAMTLPVPTSSALPASNRRHEKTESGQPCCWLVSKISTRFRLRHHRRCWASSPFCKSGWRGGHRRLRARYLSRPALATRAGGPPDAGPPSLLRGFGVTPAARALHRGLPRKCPSDDG